MLQARTDGVRLQQLLLVADAHAQVRGDGVGQAARLVDAGQGLHQLGRQLAVGLDVLLEQAHQRTHDRLDLALLAVDHRLDHAGLPRQHAVALGHLGDLHARHALHQDLDGPVGELQQLQHLRQRADVVQVVGARIVGLGRTLGDQQDALVGLHGQIQCADRLVAADEQRDDHVREHDDVTQRQHRQV